MKKMMVAIMALVALYATANASSEYSTFSPAGISPRLAEQKISPSASYIMAMGVEQAIIEFDSM